MSESALGGVEDQRRLLLECVTDHAIFQLDPDGRVADWNAGAEHMLGYHEEEIVGRSVSLFYSQPDIDAGEPARALRAATEAGRISEERWVIGKGGSQLWVRAVTTALRDEAGTLSGFARVLQDKSAQRRAEEALSIAERRYRALMENAWDGVTLVAADGTMLETTPITFRGLGYSEQEYVGQNGFELLHSEDAPAVRELMTGVLQQPGARVSAQYRLRHKDGSWRWVEAVATNLLSDPSVKAVVVNHRDITNQKDAQRRKDEWLAMLAHELRGPLRSLAMTSSTLEPLDRNSTETCGSVSLNRPRLARLTASFHSGRLVENSFTLRSRCPSASSARRSCNTTGCSQPSDAEPTSIALGY